MLIPLFPLIISVPVAELGVDVVDEVPDSGQGVELDELPLGTERSVDLLLDVLLESLADHPVVEQLLVLHWRRENYFTSIQKSPCKVPRTLPGPLSVCVADIVLRHHHHSWHSATPPATQDTKVDRCDSRDGINDL